MVKLAAGCEGSLRRFTQVLGVAVVLGAIAGVASPTTQGRSEGVPVWLGQYVAGDVDAALAGALERRDVQGVVRDLRKDGFAWVRADTSESPVRRRAFASFVVEVAHAHLQADWGRFAGLLEELCEDLRASAGPSVFELRWHRAVAAVAARARARAWLLSDRPVRPETHGDWRTKRDFANAHIVHAQVRYPDEQSFRLLEAAAWLWLGMDVDPPRNERPPVAAASLARAPQLALLPYVLSLAEHPSTAAEAHIQAGRILLSVNRFAEARRAFSAAVPESNSPASTYRAHYLLARTLEAENDLKGARADYERAAAVIPTAETAALALGQLASIATSESPEQRRVNDIFDTAARTPDPIRLLGYGDYVHWQELRDQMRAAVR